MRIRYALDKQKMKCTQGSSKIGINGSVYCFEANQLQIHGGRYTWATLELLSWDSDDQRSAEYCLT